MDWELTPEDIEEIERQCEETLEDHVERLIAEQTHNNE